MNTCSFTARAVLDNGHISVTLTERRPAHEGSGIPERASFRDGETRECGSITLDSIASWISLRDQLKAGGINVEES